MKYDKNLDLNHFGTEQVEKKSLIPNGPMKYTST
jgi:hypothetical protein